ncbi:MAG: glycosyltransferase [Actinomycetota bacterium]
MSACRASIVVPTTGDRGPLLPLSVGSALRQSVGDIEVLVIGDGVDDDTAAIVESLVEADERVRFFRFPKDDRRGELNRHEVLTDHAQGRIVTYLCDRDLYLGNHIEAMEQALVEADFGHTLRFRVSVDGGFTVNNRIDLRLSGERRRSHRSPTLVPLTFAGHTLDAYRRLPFGWRTTPSDRATDRYMFEQFLDQGWVRVGVRSVPTALTFKRGDHPGWSTAQRLEELERWYARLDEPDLVATLTAELLEVVDADRGRLEALLRPRTSEDLRRRLPTPARWAVDATARLARRVR